jgi:hypothetical protein
MGAVRSSKIPKMQGGGGLYANIKKLLLVQMKKCVR